MITRLVEIRVRHITLLVHPRIVQLQRQSTVKHWQNTGITDAQLQSDIERWKDQKSCNAARFLQFIHKQTAGGAVLYLTAEAGQLGDLIEQDGTAELIRLETITGTEELLQRLCSKGTEIDWQMYYRTTGQEVRRIAVPASPMKATTIWRNMQ